MSELDLSRFRTVKGASISEYQMYSPSVARVVANIVGQQEPAELADRILACLNNKAAPIRGSFRQIPETNSAIGFVRLVTPVLSMDEKVVASMKKLQANVYMDESDQSIWEVRSGSTGKHLARKGQDNLAELIEASRTGARGSTPRIANIRSAAVTPSMFVAYVEPEAYEVDHGFCVKSNGDSYSILSSTTSQVVDIHHNGVVGFYSLEFPKEVVAAISKKSEAKVTAAMDTQTSIEYYKKAYSYAPDYIESIIRQITKLAAM